MKISRQFALLLEQFIISLTMSFFMSLALMLIKTGLFDGFFFTWIKSWGIAFIVALPISIAVVPVIKRSINKLDISD